MSKTFLALDAASRPHVDQIDLLVSSRLGRRRCRSRGRRGCWTGGGLRFWMRRGRRIGRVHPGILARAEAGSVTRNGIRHLLAHVFGQVLRG
jgi:hypothetical protein